MQQVPNVKFNVAKMLQRIAPLLDRPVLEHNVKPCLSELCDDQVRMAGLAVAACC